jgi:hypothetical protein
LNWSTKRYNDDFDHVFCDPLKAERIKFQEQNGLILDGGKNGDLPF